MITFDCRVLTPQGQIVNLKLNGENKIACLKKLKANGMTPISVEENQIETVLNKKAKHSKSTATIYSKRKTNRSIIDKDSIIRVSKQVTIQEVKDFTQEFLLLISSKFTIKDSLKTIIDSTENVYFKSILKKILVDVKDGKKLYKSMRKYSNVFPQVYINFIKNGELSNDLEHSLETAITYLINEEKTVEKIRNELIPNMILFLGVIGLVFISILIGIPLLTRAIISTGNLIAIPKPTLILNSIFNFIIRFWFVWIILIGGGIYLLKGYVNTEEGKEKYDTFKYKNVLFGKIFYLIDFSRVIRSIFYNLTNKARIEDALETSKHTTKNIYMLGLIEKALNNLYSGKSWLKAFEEDKKLDPIIMQMLKKSFSTNSDEMLEKTVTYIDHNIEKEIDKTIKKLPLISYTIVGIALLLFILLVFIPCLQIYLGGFRLV